MIRFFDGTVARRVEALVALFVLCSAVPLTQAQAEGCYPITAQDLRRPNVPRFDQYSVPVPQVTPAPVDLNSHPSARRYRSVLRAGAGKRPNFAGHYSVVSWGCGSSCVQFAVVDAVTGRVYFPTEFTSTSGVRVNGDGFEPEANKDGYWGLRYRVDSRLLIVVGALDEDVRREGATYYSFDNGPFRQVQATYLKKRSCEPNGTAG